MLYIYASRRILAHIRASRGNSSSRTTSHENDRKERAFTALHGRTSSEDKEAKGLRIREYGSTRVRIYDYA